MGVRSRVRGAAATCACRMTPPAPAVRTRALQCPAQNTREVQGQRGGMLVAIMVPCPSPPLSLMSISSPFAPLRSAPLPSLSCRSLTRCPRRLPCRPLSCVNVPPPLLPSPPSHLPGPVRGSPARPPVLCMQAPVGEPGCVLQGKPHLLGRFRAAHVACRVKG